MHPDGRRVVFMEVPLLERLANEAPRDFIRRRSQAQQWFSITPDGLDPRELQPDEAARMTRDRGLSPDGKWLVYSKQVDGVTGLHLRDPSAGSDRLLDQGR